MTFLIEGKVALVTGGASGIGFDVCKKLLRDGAKGVTIADINQKVGEAVVEELKRAFGETRVIFVTTDVSNKASFEQAFKRTIETFKNIDILINNAGILDDRNYEREIDVNFKGSMHGIALAIQKYITQYKSGSEGVIVNTASVAGTRAYPSIPVYCATKSALVALTMTFGDEINFKRTNVRVLAIAPGLTDTNIISYRPLRESSFDDSFSAIAEALFSGSISQSVDIVGENILRIIREKPSGTVWISEEKRDMVEYFPSRPTYKPTK